MSTAVPMGSGRGGLANTTTTPGNTTHALSNTTPAYGSVGYPSSYDMDSAPLESGSSGGGAAGGHHEVKRLEGVIDRILKGRGPPTSSLGNPGPLGLCGFAATTFLLSCWNAGLLKSSSNTLVLPMALWYGGITQFAAGMWEFAANNTFGATAFCSYGAFWVSYATLIEFWLPQYGLTLPAYDLHGAIGMFLLPWTFFTFFMLLASLRMSWALINVFFLLSVTFALLSGGWFIVDDAVGYNETIVAGGWFGIFTAFAAWYAGIAVVINGTFGAQLLPIGVIGPLTHTTPGMPHAIKRRLTSSNIQLDDEDAVGPVKSA